MPEQRYIGVMADEVLEHYPDCIIKDKDGFLMVDYGKLAIYEPEILLLLLLFPNLEIPEEPNELQKQYLEGNKHV